MGVPVIEKMKKDGHKFITINGVQDKTDIQNQICEQLDVVLGRKAESKPAQTEKKADPAPVVEEKKEEVPAPVEEKKEEVPAPVEEQPAPVEEQPAPVEEEKKEEEVPAVVE